ncbi:MAG: hypothetical protein HDR08_08860 [Lachnospiraceae bacterium]|nr:hypothetical protein [Lachnospiraceae bacterium]
MNILVIGNGFDLAHGLPTKYTDFLEFCKLFTDCYRKRQNSTIDRIYNDIGQRTKTFLNMWFRDYYEKGQSKEKNSVKLIEEFNNSVKDNFWINYFLQCDMHGDENWIDFESEISQIIQSIDTDMNSSISQHYTLEDKIQNISNKFVNEYYAYWSPERTYKGLRDKLLADLNRLIRAFEIYLTKYVEKIECRLLSPDIQEIILKKNRKSDEMSTYDTYVLSFNYTNTYQKLYGDKVQEYTEKYIDYIHGKADINGTIENNNMVLGIDEYLSDDRKNRDMDFIAFKKFYQRIYKQTGCKYKNWTDRIRRDYFEHLYKFENVAYMKQGYMSDSIQRMSNERAISALKNEECPKHNLYIFGHSLDVTDGDILRDLILNDNVYTTIYYHNKDVMGQQIANLVKVIGQDELIKRTGGSTKTIEFKQQQDIILIE